MLSFEDFFAKKKINLEQFQAVEPALFSEFSAHYPLMGEKSFDHTKKYWFNSLRRSYPLAQEPKPHKVQAEAISQMAVQGVAVAAAQNLDTNIDRPKFKEDELPDLVEDDVPDLEVSLEENERTIIAENILEINAGLPIPKPAFKPRFNAKNIKKTETAATPAPETEKPKPETIAEEEPAKPTFKPRFQMQNIKKEPIKTVSETEIQNLEPKAETKAEPITEYPEQTEEAKPVYKPRFQMKNIKPATGNSPPATE